MHLDVDEKIIKIYHHHPTPFVFQMLKAIAGTFPFLLLLFVFQNTISDMWYIILNLAVFFLFALVVTYLSLIYWLDKMVLTNKRIVHIDWKYLTARGEGDVLLSQIEDIQTEEKGLLAYFKVFDYGLFKLDTASSYVALEFKYAPDPEGIRKFVYHIKNQ